MNEGETAPQWHPTRVTLVAGLLVGAGLLLVSVSWWFALVAGAGVFGPGILRELRVLRDQDEFQLQVNYRAGYHAYLVAGVMAFFLLAYFRSGARKVDFPQELATLFLTLLWFTWFLSSLIGYWGAQKAAFRMLVSLGSVWLVFAILSNVGSEWTGWTAFLLHPLLSVPFFGLAWLSNSRPRIAGGLLVIAALFFVYFFQIFRRENLAVLNQAVVLILFIGPLLASGIALLCYRDDVAGDDEIESEVVTDN